MKRTFYIIIFLSFSTLRINAQFVTIPDPNFILWLQNNGFAACLTGNMLDTTCNSVTSLTTLDCNYGNIYDLEGIQYFDSLKILKCENNYLSSISILPPTLTILRCAFNQITVISAFPNTLTYFDCYQNQLTNLPAIPATLNDLQCSYNNLISLPNLPPNLSYLHCSQNQLSYLPSLPGGLLTLDCSGNNLTSLPPLPNSITLFSCSYNQITNISGLPSSLLFLLCQDNQLNALPLLPVALKELYCDINQIDSLPNLPTTLLELSCFSNQLTFLPTLPNSLQILRANDNDLTALPTLPQSLTEVSCPNNQLTDLPELPPFLTTLAVQSNLNLNCLPKLTTITNLNFQSTGVQCLPNYGTVANSSPLLSTLPLCDIFNLNVCDFYWNISGKTYSDSSNNCIAEPAEQKLQNLKVKLFKSGILQQQTYTGGEGFYSFETDTGSYEYSIDTTQIPVQVTCPMIGYQTSQLTIVDSTDFDMDFGLQCKNDFDIGITSIHGWNFRPGNITTVQFFAGDLSNLYGLRCANGISGYMNIIKSGPATFVGPGPGALIPQVSGDTLTYLIPDYYNINYNSDFAYTIQTDTSAIAGDHICFDVEIFQSSVDLDSSNNTLVHCFNVTNSYDPNNIVVYPAGTIDTLQNWLTYTINFQNTGNAPAQHIYILDTLDSNIDESTFELLSYSHQPLTQIIGSVIRFNFPNINLPDSLNNEPDSHGFVQYKVKLKNGIPPGTTISNTANIYFDFNSPVATNTVVNEIVLPVFIPNNVLQNENIILYPNPNNGNFQIRYHVSEYDSGKLEVIDINGKTVFEMSLLQGSSMHQIALPQNIASGFYNCVLSAGNEQLNHKLAIIK